MDESIHSHVPTCGCTDNGINWACKICKDLPDYAGVYLWQREYKKSEVQNKDEQRTDLIHLKYYYALLHLLDEIHNLPECPNPKHPTLESAVSKCPTPKRFDYYRKIYNTYATILMLENILDTINLKCDICAVLPYALFSDLNMVAKNIHSDDMEKAQKLELDAIVTDYYLDAVGPCEHWERCPNSSDWLELKNSVRTLKEYLETGDRKALNISLSNWNKLRTIDNLLNTGLETTSRDFQARDIPLCVLQGKKIVYLDFGVYQLYENNDEFRKRLDAYAEMDKIQFVYSPTHMEEVCRMNNSAYEGKRRENISKICSDYEVLPDQNGRLKIFAESVDVCFARAKKLQDLNRNAEESECATFEALEEQTCRLLGWDEKEMEKRRKAISSLTSIQLFNPENRAIDNESLNKVFLYICDSQIQLENFIDYIKKERPFPEIRKAIRSFYILMNALGYHRNKIEKRTKFTHNALYPTYAREFYRTIRSGFYDVDHLCYASKCDYFITCDCELSLQAKEIYRYLGCKTNVIYCEKKAPDPSLPLAVLCKKTATP